jgi:hypothetical protein
MSHKISSRRFCRPPDVLFSVLAGAIVFNVIKEKLCPAAGTPGFGVFWPELCRTRRCCRHCSRDLIDGGAGDAVGGSRNRRRTENGRRSVIIRFTR